MQYKSFITFLFKISLRNSFFHSDKMPNFLNDGRYEIIEELGKGTFGQVFLVHDKKLNDEKYIHKIIHYILFYYIEKLLKEYH